MRNIIKKINIISGIYSVVGFIFGTLLFYILEKIDISSNNREYLGLVIIIFFITNLLLIDIKRDKESNTIAITSWIPILVSLILSILYYFVIRVNIENYQNLHYYNGYETYLGFSLILIYIVIIIYIKSFFISKPRKIIEIFSYKNLLTIFVEYNFKISSSFMVLGSFWIILSLWSILFKLININIFYNIFFDYSIYIPLVLSSTIYFTVYGLVNHVTITLKNIKSRLSFLQLFLEIISVFLILFIVFLPIMGPQKIFKTGYSSIIMLTLNGIGLTLIQFIDFRDKNIIKIRKYLVTSFIVLEPIFSFLAFYSITLRINQYGISPQRFMAVIIILLFTIFNISYLYTVIKNRLNWKESIEKQTPYLVIVSVFIIFLTITPILNPYEISVKSQMAIFGNNIEKLDLISLKFKFSKPGLVAFNKLKIKYKDDKKAMELISKVDKCKREWSCKIGKEGEESELINTPKAPTILNIHSEGKYPENIEKLLNKYYKSPNNYRNATIIVKEFLSDYPGKEIIVINNMFLMGYYRNYIAIFVKNDKNQYTLLEETILSKSTIIDIKNIKLIEKRIYTIDKE